MVTENRTKHEPTILAGMWFHSFEIENGKRAGFKWQGHIYDVIRVGATHYLLVDLYDWIIGGHDSRCLVPFTQAVEERWEFHDSDDAMRMYYDAEVPRYERIGRAMD
jgi:hypothetical protein